MITVGCDRASSTSRRRAPAASARRRAATVGLHPHEARHGVDTIVDLFDAATTSSPSASAGSTTTTTTRRATCSGTAFAAQIALAHELGLPLVIHTREAWDDTFAILDAEGVPERTVFHCFTGGPDEARRCLDRGAYVSFSGIVTFKAPPTCARRPRSCPLDRLLVETDSPYLAPVPHRGKRNRPAWVPPASADCAGSRERRRPTRLRTAPAASAALDGERTARACVRRSARP